jgi:hypothetical protein
VAWRLAGEYFENCNCNVVCPCEVSMQNEADNERCRVPLICHIEDGEKDGVSLDGLNFILLVDSPQVMGNGNWRVGVYIDERADEEQRGALGEILSGAAGGVPEALGPLIGEQLGVKFVPIEYESSNGRRRAVVPGIMEFEVEGAVGADGKVIELINVEHPMGSNLPIAKSVKGRYDDPDWGLAFDNTGKNGNYREFAWEA